MANDSEFHDVTGRKLLVGSWVRVEKGGRKNWWGTVTAIKENYIEIQPRNRDFIRPVKLEEVRVVRTKGKAEKRY